MPSPTFPFPVADSGTISSFANPFNDIAQTWMPRNQKEILKWAEYFFLTQELYSSAVQRVARYFITSIVYDKGKLSDEALQKYKDLFEKVIGLKEVALNVCTDTIAYGTSFSSVYIPVNRALICPSCKLDMPVDKVEYELTNYEFVAKCPKCEYKGPFKVDNRTSTDAKRVHVIRWDPKLIDISQNPITGECQYYLEVDKLLGGNVVLKDKLFINHTPWEFLQALKENRQMEMKQDNFICLKQPSLAGTASAWGQCPALTIFRKCFRLAVLNRANECIAQDFVMPFRIISPGGTGSMDPTMSINLQNFVGRIEEMVTRHRKDPAHIQVAPIPIQYQAFGAEARNLLSHDVEKLLAENILNGLNVPAELYVGNLQIQALPSALRLFENIWEPLRAGMSDWLQKVADLVAVGLNWDPIKISFEKPSIADNIERRQVLLSLAGAQVVSTLTALREFGIDFKEEQMNKLEEAKVQKQVSDKALEERRFLEETEGGEPMGLEDMQAQAVSLAQNLLAVPAEQRRSELSKLAQYNELLHALVLQYMRKIREQNKGVQQRTAMGVQATPPIVPIT